MNLTALLNFYPLEALGSFWLDSMSTSSGSDTLFRLYGFRSQGRHYGTFSTSKIITDVLKELYSDVFGGCCVTVPIKGAIIPYLDDIEPKSKATGAVNTIVKVPAQPESGGVKLIGTNTDIFGVENALLRSLHLKIDIRRNYMGRSAIYTLSSVGPHPIYVLKVTAAHGREPIEAIAMIEQGYAQQRM
ncbi:hypothetical protein E1B28_010057 [Marasmius oreades]|uniref:Shikimate dehydrogenase substrate binding N-terminal domain-containing protein n=1 Tax=Marasmius oreades TaxID=181124 RepID=A0A9P7RWJ9_9AGAR|nr:uncharacterized protein E1B28_010057 [Marasmius oreades]KAG7090990.1 hypothetical protein E1B28_010057 [Marasmius oreades]